jgi:ADP-ribose pyrophosphatase
VKILETKKFSVHIKKFILPNGREYESAYVNHRGSVVVIPFLTDNELLMIKQYRPILGKWLIEFPAGTIEENEPPENTARRELIEETGYSPNSLEYVHSFYVSPGITNEKMYIFIAKGLRHVGSKPEYHELIEVIKININDLYELVRKKVIEDGKSLVAVMFLNKFL